MHHSPFSSPPFSKLKPKFPIAMLTAPFKISKEFNKFINKIKVKLVMTTKPCSVTREIIKAQDLYAFIICVSF